MLTVLMGTGSGLAQAEPQAIDRGVFKWVPKEMGEVPAWAGGGVRDFKLRWSGWSSWLRR